MQAQLGIYDLRVRTSQNVSAPGICRDHNGISGVLVKITQGRGMENSQSGDVCLHGEVKCYLMNCRVLIAVEVGSHVMRRIAKIMVLLGVHVLRNFHLMYRI